MMVTITDFPDGFVVEGAAFTAPYWKMTEKNQSFPQSLVCTFTSKRLKLHVNEHMPIHMPLTQRLTSCDLASN